VPPRDPRRSLLRLVARLEERSALVTLEDLERAARRRRTAILPPERVAALVEEAVGDELLLVDRRTFFDRATGAFSTGHVYRVNRRHPAVRAML
jgi:hypothetical protein